MAKIVVGLFRDAAIARDVTAALVQAGCRPQNLSLVAHHPDAAGDAAEVSPEETSRQGMSGAGTGLGLGALLGGLGGLLVGLGTFALPGVGIIAVAGPLLSLITGASLGGAAGSIVGIFSQLGVPEGEAHGLAEGLRRGNAVVLAQVTDEEAAKVTAEMNRFQPLDLETLAGAWRQSGWERFNPSLAPLSREELDRERGDMFTIHPVAGAESGSAEVNKAAARVYASQLAEETATPMETPPRTADAEWRDRVLENAPPPPAAEPPASAPAVSPERKEDRP